MLRGSIPSPCVALITKIFSSPSFLRNSSLVPGGAGPPGLSAKFGEAKIVLRRLNIPVFSMSIRLPLRHGQFPHRLVDKSWEIFERFDFFHLRIGVLRVITIVLDGVG